MDRCDTCGTTLRVGDWPCCGLGATPPSDHTCDHGRPTYTVDAHEPVFDISLGATVASSHERNRLAQRMGMIEKKPPADTPAMRADIRDRQMAKRETSLLHQEAR